MRPVVCAARQTVKPVLSLLTLSLFCATANAQESAPAPDHKLETIEVTAQKRTQNLQDVPIAVTALNGDTLAEKANFDIFDVERSVPTLSAFQSQSATNSAFAIRGIGTSSQNFGFESSVGLYVDGVYRARQNSVINDLVDLQSIEILRGPQGSLFGKNTPSGAVVINTTAPDFEQRGFLQFTAGNFDTLNVSGAKSVTVIDNTLAVRLSGFSSQRDGWVDDLSHPHQALNNRDRSGARLQALYTPTADISLRLIADYAELDERCCAALTWQDNQQANDIAGKFGTDALIASPLINGTVFNRAQYFDYTTALSTSPRSAMQDKGLSAQLDWQLTDDLALVAISAYRQFDSFDAIDSDFSDANLLATENDAKQQAFTQEIRLHYDSKTWSAIAGVFYFKQQLDLDFTNTIGNDFPAFFASSASALQPLLDGLNTLSNLSGGLITPAATPTPGGTEFIHNADQDQDSFAVFAQTDWRLAEQWTLTSGLRWTTEEKDLTGQFTEQGPGIDGLSTTMPNPALAGQALSDIAVAFGAMQMPPIEALAAIAPFQSPGWGFYFLNTASVLPRPAMAESLAENNLSGTVKLSYQPNDNGLFYLSWANGFKSGGINTDRIASGFDPVFNAETSRSWEVGVKYEFAPQDLRVNVALHKTDIDDFQASTFTGTGFNLQNAGSIASKGLELDLIWLPASSLQLSLNFARNLARFDAFDNGTCWVAYTWHTGIDDPGRVNPDDPYCSRAGDRIGFEPETRYTLATEYYLDVMRIPTTLRVDYQYSGDLFMDDTNDPYKHLDSFELLNASWVWELHNLDSQIIVWSKNLLDEDYVAKNGFDVPVQAGKIMAYPGMPRTYGVTWRSQF